MIIGSTLQTEDDIMQPSASDAITKAELRKSILAFAWPCLAELMLVSLISVVNQAIVGHLGAYAISAVGLTNQPVLIGVAVFQAFNVGATALVARFMGARDYASAKVVVIQTLIISTLSGITLAIIGFIFSGWIVVAMGAQADTVQYAELYLKYMSVGFVFQAIPTAISSLLRGAGDTRSPMRYNIISNIVNIVAGYVLIYGFSFIPGMGVRGAAIATTLAKLTACVLSIWAIAKTGLPVSVSIRDKFKLDFGMLKKIANIGYAAAGEQLAMRVGFLIYTKIIADLGTVPFAAHQVCNSINGLSFNFGQALGMAATSYTGRFLGAKKPELAEAYCKELRRMGLLVSVFIMASFFLAGRQIASLFTTDTEVIAVSAYLMRIIVFMVPAQNSQLIISGGLRGAGDITWTLISTLTGVILVRVPLVILFIKVFHYGIGAAWIAADIDQYIRSTVVYFRFRSGKWKQVMM
jgi:putative MATE family efflux protein